MPQYSNPLMSYFEGLENKKRKQQEYLQNLLQASQFGDVNLSPEQQALFQQLGLPAYRQEGGKTFIPSAMRREAEGSKAKSELEAQLYNSPEQRALREQKLEEEKRGLQAQYDLKKEWQKKQTQEQAEGWGRAAQIFSENPNTNFDVTTLEGIANVKKITAAEGLERDDINDVIAVLYKVAASKNKGGGGKARIFKAEDGGSYYVDENLQFHWIREPSEKVQKDKYEKMWTQSKINLKNKKNEAFAKLMAQKSQFNLESSKPEPTYDEILAAMEPMDRYVEEESKKIEAEIKKLKGEEVLEEDKKKTDEEIKKAIQEGASEGNGASSVEEQLEEDFGS